MTVVICTYTDQRLVLLLEAIDAVVPQLGPGDEALVVVDHNEAVRARLAEDPRVRVIANVATKGLSGARNSGIAAATTDVVAFLDDDARPTSTWLADLLVPFAAGDVAGVGGLVRPRWEAGRPTWFPPELDWVVGCSYTGQALGDVRNPIGANMAFRRSILDAAGRFTSELGRVGTVPLGCEETELGLRVKARGLGRCVLLDSAAVDHYVPAERATPRYLVARCYNEGLSKAVVSRLARDEPREAAGDRDALGPERRYLRDLAAGLGQAVVLTVRRRQVTLLARVVVIPVGLAATVAGYGRGRLAGLAGRGS